MTNSEINLGRWATPDKLGGNVLNPQSLNRYAYALNSPATNIDPMGTDSMNFGGCVINGLPDGEVGWNGEGVYATNSCACAAASFEAAAPAGDASCSEPPFGPGYPPYPGGFGGGGAGYNPPAPPPPPPAGQPPMEGGWGGTGFEPTDVLGGPLLWPETISVTTWGSYVLGALADIGAEGFPVAVAVVGTFADPVILNPPVAVPKAPAQAKSEPDTNWEVCWLRSDQLRLSGYHTCYYFCPESKRVMKTVQAKPCEGFTDSF